MSYSLGDVLNKLASVDKQLEALLAVRKTLRTVVMQSRCADAQIMSDDELIRGFIYNRDHELAAIKQEATERLTVVNLEQDALRTELAWRLRERNATSTKGDSGTAFFADTTSVTTESKDEFTRWVIGGEKWEFVDWRPSKTAVENLLAEQQQNHEEPAPPPGVKVVTLTEVHVRKS